MSELYAGASEPKKGNLGLLTFLTSEGGRIVVDDKAKALETVCRPNPRRSESARGQEKPSRDERAD